MGTSPLQELVWKQELKEALEVNTPLKEAKQFGLMRRKNWGVKVAFHHKRCHSLHIYLTIFLHLNEYVLLSNCARLCLTFCTMTLFTICHKGIWEFYNKNGANKSFLLQWEMATIYGDTLKAVIQGTLPTAESVAMNKLFWFETSCESVQLE